MNISTPTASGQPTGTTVTWTATPSPDCNATGATYRFWINPPGGSWTIVRDYTTDNTFMWTPASPGTYQVGVWIKQAGSAASYDNFAFTTFSVISASPPTPCSSVNVGAVPASPQLVGTTITLTASAMGCPSPQYRWWVRDLAGNWAIQQDYNVPGNTFSWHTGSLPGTSTIEAVRRAKKL